MTTLTDGQGKPYSTTTYTSFEPMSAIAEVVDSTGPCAQAEALRTTVTGFRGAQMSAEDQEKDLWR